MEITAFILGICPPTRLTWLKQNIDYLEQQNFPFVKKIIAMDEFRGHKMSNELKEYFENQGWIVLVDSHMSRVKSMSHGFSLIESEYIFYNEDDVLSTMPDINDLESVFNANRNDRECGMISMTLGGTVFDAPTNNIGDLEYMNENTILSNARYRIFERDENYKNAWFFEFPGLFVKSELFKKCHEESKKIGGQIEMALTSAYFNNKFNEKYYKCSIAKLHALETLHKNPAFVNTDCRLLTNLDANQGNSGMGGNHNY